MAFDNAIDLLLWYAESRKLLISIQNSSHYDPSCPLTQTLKVLTDFYNPREICSDEKLERIYRELWRLSEYDACGRVCYDDLSQELRENLVMIEREFSKDGRIMKALRTGQMADVIGMHQRSLTKFLSTNTPPVELAWRVNNNKRSSWRFDPAQIDNFKRWLSNRSRYPAPQTTGPRLVSDNVNKNLNGNVYEIEDAECSGAMGDFAVSYD